MLFSEQEEIAMVVMNMQLEGKTTKQKHPYEKKTLVFSAISLCVIFASFRP